MVASDGVQARERGGELLGGGAGIEGAGYCRDYGDAADARAQDLADVARVDAADGYYRQIDFGAEHTQALDADASASVALGGRGEYWTNADVVDVFVQAREVAEAGDGKTYQSVGAELGARAGGMGVVLTKVHASGTDGAGDADTVVND